VVIVLIISACLAGFASASSRPGCRSRFVLMAFSEEIFWAGITSIAEGPSGRRALDRSRSFARRCSTSILPQALRLTIAPLTNRTIAITKGHGARHRWWRCTRSSAWRPRRCRTPTIPSPLMMGRGGLHPLFPAGRVAARWIETRFAWKR
jgi:polar amino acid transport system permease protein